MDMVGIAVFFVRDNRRACTQPLQRQTILRIDSGHPQYAGTHTIELGPGAYFLFGVCPQLRAGSLRIKSAGFADHRATTIAVHTTRTDIDEMPRQGAAR